MSELRGRLQSAHAIARENLLQGKAKSKAHFDKKTVQIALQVGDKVLLFDESVRRGRSRKPVGGALCCNCRRSKRYHKKGA